MAADAVGRREVVAGQGCQGPHDLLVVDDHAVGLAKRRAERRVRVDRAFHPVPAVQVRADHVGLHRARAEQRDVDDQVLPPSRLELLEQLALAGRLDLEAAEGVGGPDQLEGRLVVGGDLVEVDLQGFGPGDLVQGMAHRREHPDPEDVELQVSEDLDVVLVGLDHPVALERALQRHPVHQVVVRQHDAGGVEREVPGEALQPLGHPEQQLELPGVQVRAGELGEDLDGLADVLGPDVGEGLGHRVHLDLGIPQGLAHLADGRAGPIRVDHGHTGAPVLAVPRQDHVVDVLAPGRFDVDVDVGELVAERVQEPLEHEVVADGVDIGDAGEVADQRPGGRAPAGAADPHGLDVRDDVGDRQEVGRVSHPLDQRELEVQAVLDLMRRLHRPPIHPSPAPFGQDRGRRAPPRRGEVREVDRPKADVERARLGELDGSVAQVGAFGEQRAHLAGRLQEALGVHPRDVVLGDRHDLAHALQGVGQERVTRDQVAHRVGGDGLRADPLGQPEQHADLGGGVGLQAMLDRDEQPLAERLPERVDGVPCRVEPPVDRQRPRK